MKLTLSHPDITNEPKTYIAQTNGVAAADTSVTVKNTVNYVADNYIVVGLFGQNQSEIVKIATLPSATSLTVSAFSFPHEQDAPLTRVLYNQFKIYRSTTGIAGTYTLLATKNLMVDEPFNSYDDSGAQSNYYYKFTYYNSTSSVESSYSTPIPATGFTFDSLQYLQTRILNLFGDPSEQKVKRDTVTDYLNEITEYIQLKLAGGMAGRWVSNQDISINNATTIDISSYNFLHIFLVEYSTDGVSFDKVLMPMDFRDSFDSQDISRPVEAYFKLIDDTIYLEGNSPITGTIRIWNFSNPTRFSTQADIVPSPLNFSTEMYINYGVARCYEQDRKLQMSTYFRRLVDTYVAQVIPLLKSKLKYAKYYMSLPFRNSL